MIALVFTITSIAWDGENLYVARPGGVDVYREGKKVGSLGEEKRVVMSLATRGTRVAEGGGRAGERGEVRIWEGGKLVRVVAAHDDLVYRVAWSEDGNVVGALNGTTIKRCWLARSSGSGCECSAKARKLSPKNAKT